MGINAFEHNGGGSGRPLLDVRTISVSAGIPALECAWRELFSASGNRSSMQLPEWILTWWQVYSSNREPALIEFQVDGRLVGLAPLCRRLNRYGPGLSFKRLELMSAGVSEADSVCGEYLGLLVRPGYERVVADRFVSGLLNNEFGPWHECVLSMMDAACPMTSALRDAVGTSGLDMASTIHSVALYASLPATWEDYLAGLGKRRRGWIKSTLTDFKSWCGTSDYRVERAVDAASLKRGLEILADLHSRRWASVGQQGAFDRPRFRQFHQVFAAQLLAMGHLDLTWLTIDGVPWAAQYNFVTGGRVHFYQGGRRMDTPRRVGLGNVMIILAIQRAIERGDTEFDFLAGESIYKTRFATHRRPLTELRIARPGLRERAFQTAKAAARSFRQFCDTVRPAQDAPPNPAIRSDFRQARNVSDLN